MTMNQNSNINMIATPVLSTGDQMYDPDLGYSFCSKGGTYHKNVRPKKVKWYTSEPDLSFFG